MPAVTSPASKLLEYVDTQILGTDQLVRPDLHRHIHEYVGTLFGASVSQFVLVSGKYMRVIDPTQGLIEEYDKPFSVEEGVCGAAIRSNRPLYIPDIWKSEYKDIYLPTVSGMNAELALPLYGPGIQNKREPIGAINLEYAEYDPLTTSEVNDAFDTACLASWLLRYYDHLTYSRAFDKSVSVAKQRISDGDQISALASATMLLMKPMLTWQHPGRFGVCAISRDHKCHVVYTYPKNYPDISFSLHASTARRFGDNAPHEIYIEDRSVDPDDYYHLFTDEPEAMSVYVVPIVNDGEVIGYVNAECVYPHAFGFFARRAVRYMAERLQPLFAMVSSYDSVARAKSLNTSMDELALIGAALGSSEHQLRGRLAFYADEIREVAETISEHDLDRDGMRSKIAMIANNLGEAAAELDDAMNTAVQLNSPMSVSDARSVLLSASANSRLEWADFKDGINSHGYSVIVEQDVRDKVFPSHMGGMRTHLLELLHNSCKAIRSAYMNTREPEISIRIFSEVLPAGGSELCVEFHDSGPGYSQEQLEYPDMIVRDKSTTAINGTRSRGSYGLLLIDRFVKASGGKLTMSRSPILGGAMTSMRFPVK